MYTSVPKGSKFSIQNFQDPLPKKKDHGSVHSQEVKKRRENANNIDKRKNFHVAPNFAPPIEFVLTF